jgi:hypothetical protein
MSRGGSLTKVHNLETKFIDRFQGLALGASPALAWLWLRAESSCDTRLLSACGTAKPLEPDLR